MENIDVKQDKKKKWSILSTVLVVLAIATLISAFLLGIHLYEYCKVDKREVLLYSNLDTQIDIFSVEYKNGTGDITVQGMDGQKVVAPGTSVEYTIRLRNKDKLALDYELIPTVTYTSEHTVPVLVRMLDTDGNYLIGDAKTWVAIHDVGEVCEQGMIHKGSSTEYYFQWKWEFESGDDAYDTFLGNITDENVGVSVKFDLHAAANADASKDPAWLEWIHRYIVMTALLVALLAAVIVLVIVAMRKKRNASPVGAPVPGGESVISNDALPETTNEDTNVE